MQIPRKSRVFSDRKIAGRKPKKVCTLQNDWKPRKPSPHLVGNREQNSTFSFLPRTSSRGCIFSLLPRRVRRAVNGDTWMAILAAHTAENEPRTFSIVFLKGKPPKNHDFYSIWKHRFFRISLQANSVSCTTQRDLAHPREKKLWKRENAQCKNNENFAHHLNYLSRNPAGWPPRLMHRPLLRPAFTFGTEIAQFCDRISRDFACKTLKISAIAATGARTRQKKDNDDHSKHDAQDAQVSLSSAMLCLAKFCIHEQWLSVEIIKFSTNFSAILRTMRAQRLQKCFRKHKRV